MVSRQARQAVRHLSGLSLGRAWRAVLFLLVVERLPQQRGFSVSHGYPRCRPDPIRGENSGLPERFLRKNPQ
jgi:hypothetical protein